MVSEVVFYEEELNPDDSGNGFDTETRNIKTKFEIRLTKFTLFQLASHIREFEQLSTFGLTAMESAKNNTDIVEQYSKFSKKVDGLIADTAEVFPNKNTDDFKDISEGLFKAVKSSGLHSSFFQKLLDSFNKGEIKNVEK